MKHSFCVALCQAGLGLNGDLTAWKLQASAQENSRRNTAKATFAISTNISPTTDGYRLCTGSPGRYTLLLQHAFAQPLPASALPWPVHTDITAI